jgi:hypothetical protein
MSDGGLDRGYSHRVRISVAGISCYSVGCEGPGEASALKAALERAEGVDDAEVVHAD